MSENIQQIIKEAKRIIALSEKVSPDSQWTWTGRTDDGEYVYVPQGSYLDNTLIALEDTYENSGNDCDFITASLQNVVTFAKLIIEQLEENHEK
jgi:hypothetical protein